MYSTLVLTVDKGIFVDGHNNLIYDLCGVYGTQKWFYSCWNQKTKEVLLTGFYIFCMKTFHLPNGQHSFYSMINMHDRCSM